MRTPKATQTAPKATVIFTKRQDTLQSFLVRMAANIGGTDIFFYRGQAFHGNILAVKGDRVSVSMTHGLFERKDGTQVPIPLSSPVRASFRATENGPVEWKFARR